MLEADKYIEFLDDPDALTDDFDSLDEEQVEELKRKCVIISCSTISFADLGITT